MMAGEHGGVGDVLGNHRLAEALGRDQDDIMSGGEEVEAQHGLDSGLVDPLGPGPVEFVHRGEAADAAAEQATLQTPARALLLFAGGEVLEELGDAPPPFGGEGDDIVQMRRGVAQAEQGQGVCMLGGISLGAGCTSSFLNTASCSSPADSTTTRRRTRRPRS
jgi:hypothetical protein